MRALWSGSINFGLINIPIKLYSGVEGREVHFDLLHEKDHSRIRYARVCLSEDREVPWEEIVKGFEYEEGAYVVLTKEDFDSVALEKEKSVQILSFVDESGIDSVFYERPYYLEPDKRATKAYVLLREALKNSGKVGIAQFTFHNKEHLGVLKPFKNLLILNEIRYLEEFRETKDLKIPDVKVTKMEMDLALKLIEQLSTSFDPRQYHDRYTESLIKLIEQKAKGRKIEKKKVKAERPAPKVVDIMGLLKKSLDEKPRKKRKTA